MMPRAWLFAFLLLVLLAQPAAADPITLIATTLAALLPSIGPVSLAAGAGFGIATGTWFVAQGLAYALVAGGLVAANLLLSPRPGAAPTINPGSFKEIFEEPEAPEMNGVGRGRVSGLKAYGNTRGVKRYRLICHIRGEMDGIEDYFLDGREVLVDPDTGAVTTPPYNLVEDPFSYIFIKSKMGDGTETAWEDLVADFEGLWTEDHRVRGIAQSLVSYAHPGITSEGFVQMYQNGPPTLNIVARLQKVYDPRTETTVWTDNGIVCALAVFLRTHPQFTIDDFDIDFIIAEADRADALVDTLAGAEAEKRARLWFLWPSEGMERSQIMQQALDSIGAEIVPRQDGTKLGIGLIDDDPTAEADLPVLHTVECDWRSGPESVERPNVCRVFYYSPERNYELAEVELHTFDEEGDYTGPAWARAEDEIALVGEKVMELRLPGCPSAAQAQRIARRMFALARADTGSLRTNLAGLGVWGARRVNLELPDDLGTAVALIMPPRVNDREGKVEIPYALWPDLPAWDPETDERPAPEQLPEFLYDTSKETPPEPFDVIVVTYPDDSEETRLGFTIPGAFATTEAAYRTVDGDIVSIWLGMEEVVTEAGDHFAYVALDLGGELCRFRVRYFLAGEGSAWSPVLEATPGTDNTAPTAPALDVTYDVPNDKIIVTATVAYELQTVSIEFTWDDGAPQTPPIEQQNVRPGDVVTFEIPAPSSGLHTFTAQVFTSNGTASTVATDDVTVP